MKKVNVGIIGCGDIARKAYVSGIRKFAILNLVACADVRAEAAHQLSADLEIPRACSVEELLAAKDIDLVLNLTTPQAHAPVNLEILAANKHLYVEKPFALTREQARAVLDRASEKELLTAAAPDTFLGAGIQTCRKAIDDGWIGEPTAATAFLAGPGHESWHPNPEFYYQTGGGPLLDMGPYYLTALVNLLGPIKRVSGLAKMTYPERTITSESKYGQKIPVEVNTHISASLEFASGVITTMIMSFDVQRHNLPRIEVYGTEGTLSVPDPNTFGGPVQIFRPHQPEPVWHTVPLISPYQNQCRGIGAADLAYAITGSRPHRASGELAAHVLDAMLAIEESSSQRRSVELETTVKRPAIVPPGLRMGELDQH